MFILPIICHDKKDFQIKGEMMKDKSTIWELTSLLLLSHPALRRAMLSLFWMASAEH